MQAINDLAFVSSCVTNDRVVSNVRAVISDNVKGSLLTKIEGILSMTPAFCFLNRLVGRVQWSRMDIEIVKRTSDALRFRIYLQFHSVKEY